MIIGSFSSSWRLRKRSLRDCNLSSINANCKGSEGHYLTFSDQRDFLFSFSTSKTMYMKQSLLLFAMIIISLLSSAQSFEGMITMMPDFKTTPDPKNQVIYYVKGNKITMEARGAGP